MLRPSFTQRKRGTEMSSPFDWRSKPSTLVNDKAFNGVNQKKSLAAQAAMMLDKTLPIALRIAPGNSKNPTPYLRGVLGGEAQARREAKRLREKHEAAGRSKEHSYPMVEL